MVQPHKAFQDSVAPWTPQPSFWTLNAVEPPLTYPYLYLLSLVANEDDMQNSRAGRDSRPAETHIPNSCVVSRIGGMLAFTFVAHPLNATTYIGMQWRLCRELDLQKEDAVSKRSPLPLLSDVSRAQAVLW